MGFKEELILMYFQTVKDDFLFSDLIGLLGVTYERVNEMLQMLLDEGHLSFDEYKLITLSEKGLEYLTSQKLDIVNVFELFESKPLLEFSSFILPPNGIYVPKDFDKKFNPK